MKQQRQKGMALVTVMLVLLVLTALGITASLLMTQEEATANRQDYYRAAMYAAEAGLRKAELICDASSRTDGTTLLQHISTSVVNYAVNINPPVHPIASNFNTWDINHLGTYMLDMVGGPELVNIEVPLTSGRSGLRAFYSMYIRNNPSDAMAGGGSIISNNDDVIRLVAVGWVGTQSGKPLAVKILEEEYSFGAGSNKASSQWLNSGSAGNSSGSN